MFAPTPSDEHQGIIGELFAALHQFITQNKLGRIRVSPCDVVLSNYDVVQPDILVVSKDRSNIITEANIQGAPDLVVDVLSPATAQYDQSYELTLHSRSRVREYWIVDPDAETLELLTASDQGLVPNATHYPGDTLSSPLLAALALDLEQVLS